MRNLALPSSASVVSEFAAVKLPDVRLESRLEQIVSALEVRPCAGFPKSLVTEAALEGFYRFVRNTRVSFAALLEPHVQATLARIQRQPVALAVHDTTQFRFEGETKRKGLGRLGKKGQGFLGHFSLAVSPDAGHEPLGILAVDSWARRKRTVSQKHKAKELTQTQSRRMKTEHACWWRGIQAAEKKVGDTSSLIHIMDSAADDYPLLARLIATRRRFVIRLAYNRNLDVWESRSAPHEKTKEFAASKPAVCSRSVVFSRRTLHPVSKRRPRYAMRKQRKATLAFSATAAVFRRPSDCATQLPKTVSVNIVRAWEKRPPRNAVPVEWLLITTEPIETKEEIVAVVDYYRARWSIEEYFKALKTGCAYEQRQLESYKTLLNALALFVPIAWSLLHLRTLSRTKRDSLVEPTITDTQMRVLRCTLDGRLPLEPSVRDVLLAIARLGGHLKSNGDPGWLVLARGFRELLTLEQGFVLATRCDQS